MCPVEATRTIRLIPYTAYTAVSLSKIEIDCWKTSFEIECHANMAYLGGWTLNTLDILTPVNVVGYGPLLGTK